MEQSKNGPQTSGRKKVRRPNAYFGRESITRTERLDPKEAPVERPLQRQCPGGGLYEEEARILEETPNFMGGGFSRCEDRYGEVDTFGMNPNEQEEAMVQPNKKRKERNRKPRGGLITRNIAKTKYQERLKRRKRRHSRGDTESKSGRNIKAEDCTRKPSYF